MEKIMKLKKITALVMVAIMLMLVGCTKKETNEKTKISILFSEGASAPFKKDWLIVDEIEKRQNVELDIQVVPASDYASKRSIVLASQDKYGGRTHAVQCIPACIHIGSLGVVDILYASHTGHFLQPVFHAFKVAQTLA